MLLRSWSRVLATAVQLHTQVLEHLRVMLENADSSTVASESDPTAGLTGERLAVHHLRAAIDALSVPGMTKAALFSKLRLMLNQLEQGGVIRESARKVEIPTSESKASIISLARQGWRRQPQSVDATSRRRAA